MHDVGVSQTKDCLPALRFIALILGFVEGVIMAPTNCVTLKALPASSVQQYTLEEGQARQANRLNFRRMHLPVPPTHNIARYAAQQSIIWSIVCD